jgi:hypothetical protein
MVVRAPAARTAAIRDAEVYSMTKSGGLISAMLLNRKHFRLFQWIFALCVTVNAATHAFSVNGYLELAESGARLAYLLQTGNGRCTAPTIGVGKPVSSYDADFQILHESGLSQGSRYIAAEVQ